MVGEGGDSMPTLQAVFIFVSWNSFEILNIRNIRIFSMKIFSPSELVEM